MASTMRCFRKLLEPLLALVLAVSVSLANAAEIELRNVQVLPAEDGGFVLGADLAFDFTPRLEEAVSKGLTLHFVAEFDLTRPRWYWLDEKVVEARQTWRLTYHALTRQYRLSTGALHQSFGTLEEALRVLSRVRGWIVAEPDRLRQGDILSAALRVRLDTSQLPKPFQVEALSNKNWILASDWKRWTFTVPPSVDRASAAVEGDTK